MLNLHTTRKVQFVTLDRGTALVVLAFLVETRGTEKKIISGPRVVKIIQKKNTELAGGEAKILALPAPISYPKVSETIFESPYFSIFFGQNAEFVAGLAARPPTV